MAERERVATTLVRVVRHDPGAVSLLELGCPRTAAALALDMARELAVERPVVIVDDLPGRDLRTLTGKTESPFQLVDAADVDRPSSAPEQECHLGVGSVGPGTAWTDLGRLGSETLLVVRAGHANTLWLHTVARQLADARIPVIGVVLVHPDLRDRSDGTLWDGLHTALRGRGARRDDRQASPGNAAAANGAAVGAGRGGARRLVVERPRFDRSGQPDLVAPRTAEHPTGQLPAVESSTPETVEAS